jgi:transposase
MILCRLDAVAEVAMVVDGLFEDLPEVEAVAKASGTPRLREPVRDQIELRAFDLEALIGADHRVRTIWAYVEGLDLGAVEQMVRARTHTPGQAPVCPRLMLALWLYATSEGVGSARALAKLCTSHDAYRWLCGGVSVNHPRFLGTGFRTFAPVKPGCSTGC